MTDRRQHRRFTLDQPLTGEVQISLDVKLERLGEFGATLMTRTPGQARDPVSLRVMMVGGQVRDMMLRAVESAPVTIDGVIWRRLHCERVEGEGGGADATSIIPPRLADVLTCVIVRTVPAHVVQVSANGCLLETPRSFDHVRFARLDVQAHAGERYGAMLRVCRPGARVPGSGSSRIAAEYVPLYESTSLSIQQFVAQYEAAGAR